MFVYFLIQVVKALLHLLARVLFDNFTQLLLVKGKLVAHLLLTNPLSYTCLNPFKEVLQRTENTINLQLTTFLDVKHLIDWQCH